jgi:threonine/homoserine/homoserine lactone efflux protein
MINHLIIVGIGIGLSFAGSLPFGIINTSVAETTVRKGFRAGLWMALGASLVEFLQALVSLKLIDLFLENTLLEKVFQFVALAIFILLAAYYLWQARKGHQPKDPKVGRLPDIPDFLRGMLVCSLNVMVFPYWIFYGVYLNTNGWMTLQQTDIMLFSAGTMIGTFLALLLYAGLGLLLLRRAGRLTQYINWFLFALFLGLTLYQALKSF